MRLDLADHLKVGDKVYNCFMEPLTIISINKTAAHNTYKIIFTTTNTSSHKAEYDYKDLYLEDLYGESDDEKAWVNWAKENKDFVDTFDHIETMKEIYKTAFCHGFEYKKHISFEEMMQK